MIAEMPNATDAFL